MKIANIDRENVHIWTTWEISIKFSEKTWLEMISKATKETKFHLSFERYILGKIAAIPHPPPQSFKGEIRKFARFRVFYQKTDPNLSIPQWEFQFLIVYSFKVILP